MMKPTILLFLLVFSLPLMAADENDRYMANAASCAHWIGYREKDEISNLHASWIVGYLVAYNRLQKNNYDILGNTNPLGVHIWLDNWCNAHPLKDMSTAMEYLTNELWPNRIITAPQTQ